MKKKKCNHKHLTVEDRAFIEESLNNNHLIKDIAIFLRKDPTTISKEIKRNRAYKEPTKFGGISNICIDRYNCNEAFICGDSKCLKPCSNCQKCNYTCKLFRPEICPKTLRAPYVCNGCYKKSSCRLEKYYYRAKDAQQKYQTLRSSSRTGINISEDELISLDELATPLIKRGQPISHIFSKHSQEIPCTKRTFYSYVEKGVLSLGNMDLRRKVRYKKRKIKKTSIRRNSKILVGRKYDDFQKHISNNPDSKIVEMDTVEGTKGGKVLLTLFFRDTKLMLIFLLNDKSQKAVIDIFDEVQKTIGIENFKNTFPIILTDNGSEFLDPIVLEKSSQSDDKRTSIFYCDPNCSFQKGGIEKNHEYIRYVIPKGNSFNNFSQSEINLLMNHINSTARDNLNGHTPFEFARLLMSSKDIEFLNLHSVPADEVCLKPILFKEYKNS